MGSPVIKQLHFQTEGDGFKHGASEATTAEVINVYLQLANESAFGQETGPFSVTLYAGGHEVTAMSHQSMAPGVTYDQWFACGPLVAGNQAITVTLHSEDDVANYWEMPTVEETRWVQVIEAKHGAIPDQREHDNPGWVLTDLLVLAENFLQKPMQGGRFYAQLIANNGEHAAHDGQIDDGIISLPNVYVPKKGGSLRLYVDALVGDKYLRLQDDCFFDAHDGTIRFTAVQGHDDRTVTAKDEVTAADKVGVKGSMGVDWGLVKIGGEMSYDRSDSHTKGRTEQWTIRLPKDTLTLTLVK